jgi:type VI secretion system protein
MAVVAFVCLLLSGCSILGPSPPLRVEKVAFRVSPHANENSAIAVDLVLIKQSVLNDTIAKLSAADWFARKSQFKRDFPDDIVVVSWELVPGQVMLSADLDQDPKVWGAYFFARYSGAGDHRASVGMDRSVIVALDDNDFTVVPTK